MIGSILQNVCDGSNVILFGRAVCCYRLSNILARFPMGREASQDLCAWMCFMGPHNPDLFVIL